MNPSRFLHCSLSFLPFSASSSCLFSLLTVFASFLVCWRLGRLLTATFSAATCPAAFTTVTMKDAVPVLDARSVAVQTTVVPPAGKVGGEATTAAPTLQVTGRATGGPPSTGSDAETVNGTEAPDGPVASVTMFAG